MAIVGLSAWRDLSAARDDLSGLRETLASVTSGNGLEASQRADLVRRLDLASRALSGSERELASSRSLSLLRVIPPIGGMRRGLLRLLDDATIATGAARDLMRAVDADFDGASVRDGTAPLAALGSARSDLTRARAQLVPLIRRHGGLWGPVAANRRRFDRVVRSFTRQIEQARDNLAVTSAFLGGDGDRRYLLALENNAEMRAQGAVLSYAVLGFRGGTLSLERSGSVADLALAEATRTPLPAGTAAIFGPLAPTQTWQSVNASADFALSGRVMSDMFRQATGTPLDGVIAVDVVGIAALLDAVGPVQVEGIAEPVSAANVGRILLHDQYEGLPPLSDDTARRDRLSELTQAVVGRLTDSEHDPVVLAHSLGAAVSGRHLQLWSSRDDEQRTFAASGLSAVLVPPASATSPAPPADRTFHVAVENRTASKLDYFVHPAVLQRVRIDGSGDAIVTTTVRIENRAPAGAAPSYQLGPDRFTSAPGDYVGWVLLWAPAGSDDPGSVEESGLRLTQRVVTVKAGTTAEVVFPPVRIQRAVRDGRLDLRLVPQPRLEPMDLDVAVSAGKWRIQGALERSAAWDRTRSFSWKVTR